MNALNPKVSLLQKLSEIVSLSHQILLGNMERSSALAYELIHDPEVTEWFDRMVELQYAQATQSGPRVGYQLCATLMPIEEEWASYAECESHSIALDRCLAQFPLILNYTQHHVKVIETGEIIYPGRARKEAGKEAKLSGLSLGEPESPLEPEALGLKL